MITLDVACNISIHGWVCFFFFEVLIHYLVQAKN